MEVLLILRGFTDQEGICRKIPQNGLQPIHIRFNARVIFEAISHHAQDAKNMN
jgi:hypothetical protein